MAEFFNRRENAQQRCGGPLARAASSLGGGFRLKVFFRKLINRCPRRLRILGGPLLGGLAGLLLGAIPGLLIGLLLGYLLKEILAQSGSEKKILDYLKNPGSQQFYEGVPGMAACCALAVLVISKETGEFSRETSAPPTAEGIANKIILRSSFEFSGILNEPNLVEDFTRLAWSNRENLNSDLLAESLASRRAPFGDAGNLGRVLYELADSEKAKALAAEIRLILDPLWDEAGQAANYNHGNNASMPKDPWKILGLPPGTPQREVKAHYRRLAKQFHPDELEVLDEKRRETAALAFVAIKEAYQEIVGA